MDLSGSVGALEHERGGSGHRMVTLRHVPWRKSARQRRSPTFGDVDARRVMPIRRARPASTGELSVNGHGHVTPREPHPIELSRTTQFASPGPTRHHDGMQTQICDMLGIAIVSAISYVPALQSVFNTAALGAADWALVFAFGALAFAADEARKAWHRSRGRRPSIVV